jgi:acyl carrier protein
MDPRRTLEDQIKVAIVRCLRMPITADEIETDRPLFGEGFGLDSIDALEIVLELQRTFGVVVDDEQVGQRVLRSVRTIADFIESTRQSAEGG